MGRNNFRRYKKEKEKSSKKSKDTGKKDNKGESYEEDKEQSSKTPTSKGDDKEDIPSKEDDIGVKSKSHKSKRKNKDRVILDSTGKPIPNAKIDPVTGTVVDKKGIQIPGASVQNGINNVQNYIVDSSGKVIENS